jgi:PhzF family phenazine biosynthesis protein
MTIPIYQVDAFTSELFAGNPAAVCVLERWLDDRVMRSIAAENNLSETAFLIAVDGGDWELRWFTPVLEVDLCGHATLAGGFVVLTELEPERDRVSFRTRAAGVLTVSRDGDRLRMSLPARPPSPIDPPPGLIEALGVEPVEVWKAQLSEANTVGVVGGAAPKLMAVLDSEAAVAAVAPDLAWIAGNRDADGLIVTAAGRDGIDFVSRYFAPHAGIDEDPVTGSAHCTLTPYWAGRLGRENLEARQISSRGGDLRCELRGDRVELVGGAVLYMTGEIALATD